MRTWSTLVVVAAMVATSSEGDAQRLHPVGLASRRATSTQLTSWPGMRSQEAPVCRASVSRVLGQLGASMALSWVISITAFAAVDDIHAPNRRVKGDEGYQRDANVAYALGSWMGSALGVMFAAAPECQSVRRAVIGTAAVAVAELAAFDEPYLPLFGVVFGTPLQAIFGTAGIYAGRN